MGEEGEMEEDVLDLDDLVLVVVPVRSAPTTARHDSGLAPVSFVLSFVSVSAWSSSVWTSHYYPKVQAECVCFVS